MTCPACLEVSFPSPVETRDELFIVTLAKVHIIGLERLISMMCAKHREATVSLLDGTKPYTPTLS